MMIVLIDTNILLDVLQNRQPHYHDSAAVWNLVENNKLLGYVSVISFNNAFYVLRKQIGSAAALDAIKLVRSAFKVVPLDEGVLDGAISSCGADLEDAIQSSAATRVDAEYIITRNVKDFARYKVPAVTAEEFLALFRA